MNKITLPKKTKIVAWIMTIVGGMGGGIGLLTLVLCFSNIFYCSGDWIYILGWGGIGIISGLFYFIPGVFLLKRKRWAWKVGTGILSLGVVFSLGFVIYNFLHDIIFYGIGTIDSGNIAGVLIFLLPFWAPFILILLDKKNYWKIAS